MCIEEVRNRGREAAISGITGKAEAIISAKFEAFGLA
jgi:hypothetical protein